MKIPLPPESPYLDPATGRELNTRRFIDYKARQRERKKARTLERCKRAARQNK